MDIIMTNPELVAATYLEVANRHRKVLGWAHYNVNKGYASEAEVALVEIDEAMRVVTSDDY